MLAGIVENTSYILYIDIRQYSHLTSSTHEPPGIYRPSYVYAVHKPYPTYQGTTLDQQVPNSAMIEQG